MAFTVNIRSISISAVTAGSTGSTADLKRVKPALYRQHQPKDEVKFLQKHTYHDYGARRDWVQENGTRVSCSCLARRYSAFSPSTNVFTNIYLFYQRNPLIHRLHILKAQTHCCWPLPATPLKTLILISSPPTSSTFQIRIQRFKANGWWILRWSFLGAFSPLFCQEKQSSHERTSTWGPQMD